ncbi:MAG: DUF3299 domain-containing protein [Pedosphaera sp.]|nr:DUF3299 domain-containing protein [Pedosphaera sp.]
MTERSIMNLQHLKPAPTVLGTCLVAIAGLFFQGCSPSASNSSGESTAGDIRGEPINAPTQSVLQAASPARAEKTNPEKTEREGTNRSASASAGIPADQIKTTAAPVVEFTPVTFEKLASFTFEIPDEQPGTNTVSSASKSSDQIPASVKALDQKRVALKGFMLPLKVEGGLVTEMLIMRDQSMCCYGTVPKITEWVSIKMTDKGVKAIMDQPVTIFGKLRVGEIRENGYLVGIYQMDGEKMGGPVDL